MAFAKIRPSEAVSNLSKWAEFFGIHEIPEWLRAKSADRWASRVSAGMLTILLFIGGIWFVLWISDTSKITTSAGSFHQEQAVHQAEQEVIYQGGTVVGKVYGGRRLPNDATRFEFQEITNCAQFNTVSPFTYSGVRMIFERERDSAMFIMGRTDNPIRFGVIARVIE